ncbi:retropepsin-like aspartic protease family protein [Spirosoma utsteinense]|uniref:Aspartyl protease family protein n=1 Tax=Spirosoma utsteinense TaxID=2585773 RepID=A0ABR6W7R3_9BACT|nr:retropepsin-like aspartic protease [Spirosoma utsteinense]MBC3783984.1 aspartyl protease family protein [Spirosoma utsteinense]MBC3792620.1 aspartyl protease family protein [Spirosoma utsteinense]
MVRLTLSILVLWVMLYLSGCSGCSRSGSHTTRRAKRNTADQQTGSAVRTPAEPRAEEPEEASTPDRSVPKPVLKQIGDGPTEVAMERENGVYKVPVTVNGVPMKFILDTGASLISMSDAEAEFMYKQGAITKADIIGRSRFKDATGAISPGAVIRLKSVQIGDRVLENVSANIVSGTKAPLLLGQSALSQFGKISVDYRRNVVTFE